MIKNVNKGYTLLVKGPARITLIEGKVEVFGKLFLPITKKSLDFLHRNIFTNTLANPIAKVNKPLTNNNILAFLDIKTS